MASNLKAISPERTVPVTEDLTTEDTQLSIIRGLENMFRADKKVGDGVIFEKGEWAVLEADGTLSRPSATPVANSFLVFAGTDRFDAEATGQATLIMGGGVIVKTTVFNTGGTYDPGDPLTVKDLGGGEAGVTNQTGTEPILAEVIEIGDGILTYQVKR
jgi:hypothetical protein